MLEEVVMVKTKIKTMNFDMAASMVCYVATSIARGSSIRP